MNEQSLIQEEHSDEVTEEESLNDNINQLDQDFKDFQNLKDDDNQSHVSDDSANSTPIKKGIVHKRKDSEPQDLNWRYYIFLSKTKQFFLKMVLDWISKVELK